MQATDCIHHWIIAEAAGHTSHGHCINCGNVKEFLNSIVEGEFGDKGKMGRPRTSVKTTGTSTRAETM